MNKRKSSDENDDKERKKDYISDKYVLSNWIDPENKRWEYPHTVILDPQRSPWFRHDFHVFQWVEYPVEHILQGKEDVESPHVPYTCQMKKCKISGHGEKCSPKKYIKSGYYDPKIW